MSPVGLGHHVDAILVVSRSHPGQSPVHGAPVRVGHVVVPGGREELGDERRAHLTSTSKVKGSDAADASSLMP